MWSASWRKQFGRLSVETVSIWRIFTVRSMPLSSLVAKLKGSHNDYSARLPRGISIEAGTDTPFFQTGEAKYGKPIIDRVIAPAVNLSDAMKCVLVSFDSTMRSNLSVGMPIDLACYERDSFKAADAASFRFGRCIFHGAVPTVERRSSSGLPPAAWVPKRGSSEQEALAGAPPYHRPPV